MKQIFESAEVFDCYAKIDYCNFMLSRLYKSLEPKNRSPLEMAIDEATGYSAAKTKNERKQIIELVEEIISCKKKIEADYSSEQKLLNELQNGKGKETKSKKVKHKRAF